MFGYGKNRKSVTDGVRGNAARPRSAKQGGGRYLAENRHGLFGGIATVVLSFFMLVVCAVSLLLCKIVDQSNVMAAGGTTLPDSAAVKTEELTLDGYENRTDGKVFDAQILQDL